ncbi:MULTISPECIES: GNAT family N-acetyltransferase [unclassified Streptomyces]|uniref:GNAT family N-acetyltransferase n=1 Tax=unclassified Streptomyces TaxID=2593676 RepID=UPI001E5CD224|nr:GNAT family N-acetyltransferase [Streptomyces sp. CB02980]MCB8901622.1 GNAT family N-acetyltransferase [Streptomyces sp. CB02980]
MTTATPRPGIRSESVAVVRPAGRSDAAAVHRLSVPFVREGALRDRPVSRYARDAADFLVAETADGGLAGCVALHRRQDARGRAAAVLYNFCVAAGNQGRGIGSALLRAVLAEAATQGVSRVFTATAGSGLLFLRHGFVVGGEDEAPPEWRARLDPARGSRVLVRALN